MANIDEFLSRLQKVRATGKDRWQACCPAHDDKSPSFNVMVADDGKIIMKCHAGCSVEAITAAMGMELSDLFPDTEKERYNQGLRPWQRERLNDDLKHARYVTKLYERDKAAGVTIDDICKRQALNAYKKIKEIELRLKNNQ